MNHFHFGSSAPLGASQKPADRDRQPVSDQDSASVDAVSKTTGDSCGAQRAVHSILPAGTGGLLSQ